jgi:NADH:ubiquinone oxidoreductase subunit 3 (subunit A)
MVFELTYFYSYYFIVFYIGFSTLISLFLVILSIGLRYLSVVRPDTELASSYECGFIPFDRARTKFEVKFFMVALLFVIFDLEVIFILPWSICISFFTLFEFFLMFIFLVLLILSFVFEIYKEALSF